MYDQKCVKYKKDTSKSVEIFVITDKQIGYLEKDECLQNPMSG